MDLYKELLQYKVEWLDETYVKKQCLLAFVWTS